jgi:serine protease Do
MKSNRNTYVLLSLALFGLLCVAAGAVTVKADPDPAKTPGIAHLQETGKAFATVTKQVTPAVVAIKVEKRMPAFRPMQGGDDLRQQLPEDWMREFFGDRFPNLPTPQDPGGGGLSIGQGSGFLMTEDGYVMTNNHVVEGASKLTVTLADGREMEGRVVGTDPSSDVAVVKIDGNNFPMLVPGDSDAVQVGEWVLAIGSPFGLPGTVTSGIVSATGRDAVGITDYENFLQTDAAINPGNSGGPLVNLSGQVIGINTAIASRTGAYNGIGFAIPINMARDIFLQLVDNGSVTRGHLGIIIQRLTPELATSFGLESDTAGLLVGDVSGGSPADKAGIEPGDIVVEFDGKKVRDMGAFRNLVAAKSPESKVEIVVLRNKSRKTLTVTLGQRPTSEVARASAANMQDSLGFAVQPLNDQLRERFSIETDSGVIVTRVQPNSRAAAAGIRPGMLIEEINRQKVENLDDFNRLTKAAKEDGQILLRVRQGEFSQYIAMEFEG